MDIEALVQRVKAKREAAGLAFRYRRPGGDWLTYHSPNADDKRGRMAAYAARGIEVEEL